MMKAINEPIMGYLPGSNEKKSIKCTDNYVFE